MGHPGLPISAILGFVVDTPELGGGSHQCSWWVDSVEGPRQCSRNAEMSFLNPKIPPEKYPSIPLCAAHAKAVRTWGMWMDWGGIKKRDEFYRQRAAELAAIEAEIAVVATMKSHYFDKSPSYVYVLRRTDGLIKIGYTTDVRQRMKAHAREHGRLEIIGVVRARRALEIKTHARLIAHRAFRNEWYHPVPEVMEVVNEILGRRARASAA